MLQKMNARQITRLLVTTVLAVAGSYVVAHYDTILPHQWHTYSEPSGQFSVEFPATPTTEAKRVPASDGSRTIQIVSASPNKSTSYACTYFEMENTGTEQIDDLLTTARDGSLKNIQGTLVTEKKIVVSGYPGIEFEASARGNSHVVSRIVAAGKHVYMLISVAVDTQTEEPKTISRFLNSFKLPNGKSAQ